MPSRTYPIGFSSGALTGAAGDGVYLFGVTGREELSRLYEFKIYFGRDQNPLTGGEIDEMLDAPCAFAMGDQPGDVVHGLIRRVEIVDTNEPKRMRYVATVVPHMWLLTQVRTNRIYQSVSVPDMITMLLSDYMLAPGEDFELRLSGSYEVREYVVQYDETDWDFVQRWLETEGIYYYFEHGGDRDKLIIADDNASCTPIIAPSSVSYRQRNDLVTDNLSTVWLWQLDQRRLPARVAVFDYNYRTPNIRLIGEAPIDASRGFGSVMVYNDHFKTNEEGAALAKTRAERALSTQRVFCGYTDCARFRAGHVFTLEDHWSSEYSGREYLITSVEHDIGHGVPDPRAEFAMNDVAREASQIEGGYRGHFEAIPLDVPFRPERVTPWPSVKGIIQGHIEEDSAGEYASIDEVGRYKVRLPFDSGNAAGMLASRWIRMTQAYSGSGYGQHHPLHKGAEVLISHIDGDPDRPIIIGTAPHAHTPGPVMTPNQTQSVTHTASGIRIELEDLQE